MTNEITIVTCTGGLFFDRDYCVNVHLPLALECWRQYGLKSAPAFFPHGADAPDVAIRIYNFRDKAAIHAAPASRETETVMADVPRFTDARVSRTIGFSA